MPLLDINGISLHLEHHPAPAAAQADRPPLLMLAGMASDSASWLPLIEPLRQQQTLLIPDNRCSGRTSPNPVSCSRELMVDDILALLDHLDIERVNVLGHSMGGMLGWALACRAPERVARLISAAALPHIIPARIALFRSLLALRSESNEADWFPLLYQFLFTPAFFDKPEAVAAALAGSLSYAHKQDLSAFRQQVAALESFLPELPLQNVSCPITLLTGSHDVLMTPQMINDFSARFTDVSTHVVEGAAHALHWEQPERVADIIENALNGE